MKLRTRLLGAACSMTMVAGLGVAVAAPAGAVTSFAVGNDHVVCKTLSGTITFATALKISGPTTGANTITVKAAVAGCTDTDKPAVKVFSGTIASTLTTNGGSACAGISGPSTSTSGNNTTTWTPAVGQAFTPTFLVGTAQKPQSFTTVTQTNGAQFVVAATQGTAAQGPWAGTTYGEFQLGTPFGLTAGTTTGDFTGGDAGATGWFEGTTQQDIGNIVNSCFSTAGLKTVSFGLGALALG